MPKILQTSDNPFGLSIKQRLMIEDMVSEIRDGKGFLPVRSVMKFYQVKNKNTAYQIANKNINKGNFRRALIYELRLARLIGSDGTLVRKLNQGLNATQKNVEGKEVPDYRTRLDYIKEINKICRVYKSERTNGLIEEACIKINLNLSKKDLKKRIDRLQEELSI